MKATCSLVSAAVMAAGLVIHAQAPAAAPSRPERRLEVPYTQFTLSNGLHVILHEDHTVPLLTVNVWYHVGSAREKPGRTGFAHLFEHLMFMGSGHVKYGQFDTLLEAVGGTNNASTEDDRTNYYIDVPSNALDLALYLESDRMGWLLDAMSPDTVNAQRDVVKNERRQCYENAPYGMASIEIAKMLYPEGHPYRWPMIGYMEDLTAATYEDVVEFFKKYYQPSNATLVVAGDIDPAAARAAGREVVRRRQTGNRPRAADRLSAPAAHERATQDDSGSRAAAALVSRLDHAAPLRAGRRGARRRVAAARGRQELAAVQAARLRSADRAGCFGGTGVAGAQLAVRDRRHGSPARGCTTVTATMEKIRGIVDEELRKLQSSPPDSARARARDQPDRGVFLRPHGAGRRVRRHWRSAQRVLRRDRRPRLLQRGPGALSSAVRRRTSRPRPDTFFRSIDGWN